MSEAIKRWFYLGVDRWNILGADSLNMVPSMNTRDLYKKQQAYLAGVKAARDKRNYTAALAEFVRDYD